MKLRYFGVNFWVFCFILAQGLVAEIPSISEVDLHWPAKQDFFLREHPVKSCFFNDGFDLVLGQKDGHVVMVELLGLDRSEYRERVLMPQLNYPIKELAYNSHLDAVVVRATASRQFGEVEAPTDAVNVVDTMLLWRVDGRVLWHENIHDLVYAVASLGNHVVFAGNDRLFVRNIENSTGNYEVTGSVFEGIQTISFWNERVVFCAFDNHALLYDLESREILFDVTAKDLGLRNPSFRHVVFSEDGVLIVVTARGMTAHKIDPRTMEWVKLDFLDKKASSCFAVSVCEAKKVLCAIGNHFISSSTIDISYDFILLQSTNFSFAERIILNFDQKASVISATVTSDNKLVVLVAVKDNLRVVTVSFGIGRPLIQTILDRELGLGRRTDKRFPRLNGTWDIKFDDTLDKFVIGMPVAPACGSSSAGGGTTSFGLFGDMPPFDGENV